MKGSARWVWPPSLPHLCPRGSAGLARAASGFCSSSSCHGLHDRSFTTFPDDPQQHGVLLAPPCWVLLPPHQTDLLQPLSWAELRFEAGRRYIRSESPPGASRCPGSEPPSPLGGFAAAICNPAAGGSHQRPLSSAGSPADVLTAGRVWVHMRTPVPPEVTLIILSTR